MLTCTWPAGACFCFFLQAHVGGARSTFTTSARVGSCTAARAGQAHHAPGATRPGKQAAGVSQLAASKTRSPGVHSLGCASLKYCIVCRALLHRAEAGSFMYCSISGGIQAAYSKPHIAQDINEALERISTDGVMRVRICRRTTVGDLLGCGRWLCEVLSSASPLSPCCCGLRREHMTGLVLQNNKFWTAASHPATATCSLPSRLTPFSWHATMGRRVRRPSWCRS